MNEITVKSALYCAIDLNERSDWYKNTRMRSILRNRLTKYYKSEQSDFKLTASNYARYKTDKNEK